MRSIVGGIVCGLLVAASLPAAAQAPAAGAGAAPPAPAMVLTVQGFPDGGEIPVRFSQAAPGAPPGAGPAPAMSSSYETAGARALNP